MVLFKMRLINSVFIFQGYKTDIFIGIDINYFAFYSRGVLLDCVLLP